MRRLCSAFGEFSASDVDDLTQETFVRAFEQLGTLRDDASFGRWLFVIARGLCLHRLRGRAGEGKMADAFLVDPASGALAPRTEEVPDAVRIRIAREVIDELPPGPERDTIHLFYLEGELSAREIAERLGVSKSTVTMRLERFRARVKKRLIALIARDEGE